MAGYKINSKKSVVLLYTKDRSREGNQRSITLFYSIGCNSHPKNQIVKLSEEESAHITDVSLSLLNSDLSLTKVSNVLYMDSVGSMKFLKTTDDFYFI